ncbi:hypothetical protein [Campylobacter concisus]|uniref:hypothetical protein n=1 Tax=Campylobacter concisus TaxID=199 RepID=UPI0015D7A2FD|nr:hypothetical protein [Campylobacter concisus]
MVFFKVSCRLYTAIKTKCGYQICFYSQIYTKPTIKSYKKHEANSIFGKVKRGFSLALF